VPGEEVLGSCWLSVEVDYLLLERVEDFLKLPWISFLSVR
jgi:hypothetical protein